MKSADYQRRYQDIVCEKLLFKVFPLCFEVHRLFYRYCLIYSSFIGSTAEISEVDISQPRHAKPKLSQWLKDTMGRWENCFCHVGLTLNQIPRASLTQKCNN